MPEKTLIENAKQCLANAEAFRDTQRPEAASFHLEMAKVMALIALAENLERMMSCNSMTGQAFLSIADMNR